MWPQCKELANGGGGRRILDCVSETRGGILSELDCWHHHLPRLHALLMLVSMVFADSIKLCSAFVAHIWGVTLYATSAFNHI